jgi:DNA polymerase
MPARDEILFELGLAPTWRLRAIADAGPALQPRAAEAPPSGSREARIAALEWRNFAADVDGCTACGLFRGRRRSVPGVGDPNAQWLFVGEGPGAEEDAKGEPFVGQAGKLLDSMLAALGLARGANVYIANVVKCRPPGNRDPLPLEIESCRPYLEAQLGFIEPKVVVTLGNFATKLLLETDLGITRLRGQSYPMGPFQLVPTYHPAAALRSRGVVIAEMRADLVRAKQLLGWSR